MNGQKVWGVVSRILIALVFVGCSFAVEAGAAPVVTVIPPGSNAATGTYTSAVFPVDVTFTANGPATIYYTTNGAPQKPTPGNLTPPPLQSQSQAQCKMHRARLCKMQPSSWSGIQQQ